MGRLALLLLACTSFALAEAPVVRLVDRVNPVPRPYANRLNVPTTTTLYFEVVVPVENLPDGAVDTDSISVSLTPQGASPIPMISAGQVFAPGFSGTITPGVQDVFASEIGDAFYVIPDAPLEAGRRYTVTVSAMTLDGQAISPGQDSWSFTTRAPIADPSVTWPVDFGDPTLRWEGWFHTGLLKPDFNTSRLYDQLESYQLMDTVNAINPDAWSLQRDWPLTSDYWHNGVLDGNPNLVREIETRQITAIVNEGGNTLLTLTDLEEGPLYGIVPGRPLSGDYAVGDLVTVGDREKYESTQVVSINDGDNTITAALLSTPPAAWILEYDGSHPPGNPEVPDNFTLPLCYLRKFDPVGTPVYYWTRVDDEWDIVHGTHGRRLQVNFSYTPLDLSLEPVPGSTGGHGSISPPKNWLQWHEFVRTLVFHLIDRYGSATEDFYYSVGNENNFGIFWSGGKDGFYELYDYTVNAVLTAFEERGLNADKVQVGGVEAAGLGGRGWMRDAMYHASGLANRPGGGIAEQNFACNNPAFFTMLASRVAAICTTYTGRGSPMDFVSIHEYDHASVAVNSMTVIRDDALAMDPLFFDELNVTSFENTPDWIPRTDFASRKMFEGNGYFPTWSADWMQRMVARAESDTRYARHEAVLTVWPFDYNGSGQTSVTGLIRVDEDGDGTEDRVATIRKGIFNYIEMLAHLNRDLDALDAQDLSGLRFGGVRSPDGDVQRFIVYNHDKYDTESSEVQEFTATLQLSGVPWENATVRSWRVDRDHSSPYHAYQALPLRAANELYSPAEVAALEASDELVESPPQEFAVVAGAFDLALPLRVNGAVLAEVRERDLDGDGWGDGADNCPRVENPDQIDGDSDSFGSACDCNDGDADLWALPGESTSLLLTHERSTGLTSLSWDAPSSAGSTTLLHDTLRSPLPQDFSAADCLESAGSDTSSTDSETPAAGAVRAYLVRAVNGCGEGTPGSSSANEEREATSCP